MKTLGLALEHIGHQVKLGARGSASCHTTDMGCIDLLACSFTWSGHSAGKSEGKGRHSSPGCRHPGRRYGDTCAAPTTWTRMSPVGWSWSVGARQVRTGMVGMLTTRRRGGSTGLACEATPLPMSTAYTLQCSSWPTWAGWCKAAWRLINVLDRQRPVLSSGHETRSLLLSQAAIFGSGKESFEFLMCWKRLLPFRPCKPLPGLTCPTKTGECQGRVEPGGFWQCGSLWPGLWLVCSCRRADPKPVPIPSASQFRVELRLHDACSGLIAVREENDSYATCCCWQAVRKMGLARVSDRRKRPRGASNPLSSFHPVQLAAERSTKGQGQAGRQWYTRVSVL